MCLLNINQSVTCLTAGQLGPNTVGDTLVVGSQTNLLAYDVHDNADIFYKEVGGWTSGITAGPRGAHRSSAWAPEGSGFQGPSAPV